MEPVFGEIRWDDKKPSMGLHGSVKVRGEFSLLCLVHNVKRIMERVLDGTGRFSAKHKKLIAEAVWAYSRRTIDFGWG